MVGFGLVGKRTFEFAIKGIDAEIAALKDEKRRLIELIAPDAEAPTPGVQHTRKRIARVTGKANTRKPMSAAQRKAISRKMKATWKERRKDNAAKLRK